MMVNNRCREAGTGRPVGQTPAAAPFQETPLRRAARHGTRRRPALLARAVAPAGGRGGQSDATSGAGPRQHNKRDTKVMLELIT